ncbi:HD domain-containing protein [Deinococcus ficus]|uniref:Phosphohydrolase n=1 Tax=Deinococcus ficus TaxID=317577 RepID=A0A221SUN0_9DEIO|nr:HD domain-containing protein [Deinococcus ficus]ASN80321.1 phosphohydrolase [Deinococcus ficus]
MNTPATTLVPTPGSGLVGKVRRFLRSFRESDAHPDDTWARQFLTPAETLIYNGMDARDREHACRVTQHLLRDHPDVDQEVLAATLLHDCGKSVRTYYVFERVFVGLLPYRLTRLLPPRGALGIRANHPELGAKLLAHAGARPRVARLVARHHAPIGDPDAMLIHRYDDLE